MIIKHIVQFTIMKKYHLQQNTAITNIDGDLIFVDEHVINPDIAKRHFENKLNDIVVLNKTVSCVQTENSVFVTHTKSGDCYTSKFVFDCTYNQLQLSKKLYKYELTISLLYRKNKQIEFDALTIVDGLFMSLYPRNMSDETYSLTDVEYTPLVSSSNFDDLKNYNVTDENVNFVKNKMVEKIQKYYPNFTSNFDYIGYFTSNKTKLLSSSDSREITIDEVEHNLISVNCGKIYGIFEIEDYIKNVMKLI